VPHLESRVRAMTADWPIAPRVTADPAEKRAAFRIARAALAASGTVTLELALAGVPLVAAYRFSEWEAAIGKRLVRLPSVILANLVIGDNVVPEFIQEKCAPEPMAEALSGLIANTPARQAQIDAFAKLDEIMNVSGGGPSEKAAGIVLDLVRRPNST
jgi:lipid-A-disaccharide synthase